MAGVVDMIAVVLLRQR